MVVAAAAAARGWGRGGGDGGGREGARGVSAEPGGGGHSRVA